MKDAFFAVLEEAGADGLPAADLFIEVGRRLGEEVDPRVVCKALNCTTEANIALRLDCFGYMRLVVDRRTDAPKLSKAAREQNAAMQHPGHAD